MKLNVPHLSALLCGSLLATPLFAAQTIDVPPNASHEEILKLANRCTPHPRQLAWQELEYTCFVHFGPNTFTGVEWGNGKENANAFAPQGLDTDQWCRVAKEAGMTMMMMTTKHHDGFCLWQTRYNDDFSVKAIDWRDGKGDVLRELVKSAKKYGLKIGVYLSPADLYQIENEKGLYGNLSEYQYSVIPTDPENFRNDPMKGRPTPEGKPTFVYKVDDYNRYFLNQLYELLTEYGEVDEVWFDGAHPKRKGGQVYTYNYWYDLIRKLAPNAVIQGKGPDARWVGNEHGGTREEEWSPLPLSTEYHAWTWPDRTGENISRDDKFKNAKAIHWYPSEVDVSIRHGWFYRDERQHVRDADDVFDMYERSIGGNNVFLLNVPPTKEGVFGDRDTKTLLEVGQRIRKTYGKNLLDGATAEARLLDANINTGIVVGAEGTEIKLPAPQTINRFMVQEQILIQGQRTKAYTVDAKIDGDWQTIAEGRTIGYKNILRFAEVTSDQFRVRILDSRAKEPVILAEVGAYFYAQPPLPVKAKRVGTKVELHTAMPHGHAKGPQMTIHYTLDGSEPTADSAKYEGAIELPKGGTVKARSEANGELGSVGTFYIGIDRANWKVSASSAQDDAGEGAKMAIDGDPNTIWHSSWRPTTKQHPHTFTIDLGSEEELSAFAYTPRSNNTAGLVEKFRLEISKDGQTWETLEEGTFGNLVNDPSSRIHWFESPVETRYFRFVSLEGAQGRPFAAAAEIELMGK